jgi:hypothetical protein
MAVTNLTTTPLNGTSGTVYTLTAANVDGHYIKGGGRTFLAVANGAGAPITVTIDVPGNTSYGAANPDVAFTVTNGTTKLIPLNNGAFVNKTTGKILVTFSSVTTITCGAFSI